LLPKTPKPLQIIKLIIKSLSLQVVIWLGTCIHIACLGRLVDLLLHLGWFLALNFNPMLVQLSIKLVHVIIRLNSDVLEEGMDSLSRDDRDILSLPYLLLLDLNMGKVFLDLGLFLQLLQLLDVLGLSESSLNGILVEGVADDIIYVFIIILFLGGLTRFSTAGSTWSASSLSSLSSFSSGFFRLCGLLDGLLFLLGWVFAAKDPLFGTDSLGFSLFHPLLEEGVLLLLLSVVQLELRVCVQLLLLFGLFAFFWGVRFGAELFLLLLSLFKFLFELLLLLLFSALLIHQLFL